MLIRLKKELAEGGIIGTAIGMSQHVAFPGGWNNVGSAARKRIVNSPAVSASPGS